MYLTYYWLFSWVCSFLIKHALNEYLKQNNNEKAKTTITTKKIGQEHDFKNWDAYCIAQNAERKTRCFVCERKTCNVRHATAPRGGCRFQIPYPPARNFFAKPQSVKARTRKEFDNPLAKQSKEVTLNIKFT